MPFAGISELARRWHRVAIFHPDKRHDFTAPVVIRYAHGISVVKGLLEPLQQQVGDAQRGDVLATGFDHSAQPAEEGNVAIVEAAEITAVEIAFGIEGFARLL